MLNSLYYFLRPDPKKIWTGFIDYLQYHFDETIFLLIILVPLLVFQCLFKVPLKQYCSVLCNWLLPHNHIVQLCRHASPSPIIEGVIGDGMATWLFNTPNLITILMSSWGKIFVIQSNIKSEMDRGFLRGKWGGVTCTSGLYNQ